MDGESLDIKQDRLQRLKELLPELFAENQLDWEKLKAAFGDDINFVNERYVLNWAGKSEAFRVLQQPTTATLKPALEESYPIPAPSPRGEGNWGGENLFIEGENLEVLKVLQKAYYGKVKCIIIDPPYNTGSDSFIYTDRFSEKKEDYLKRIGDKDEEGFLLKKGFFRKNSKDSGHYHSNWLSMMYPRLFLAKNLLRDDGVIFVHIDDNEVHNLRLVMNEIFGEENFVEVFIWRSRLGKGSTSEQTATLHEYIICYAKRIDMLNLASDVRIKQSDSRERLRQWGQGDRKEDRPTMYYPVHSNEYGEVYPIKPDGTHGRWRLSKEKFDELLSNKQVIFEKQNDGRIEAYKIILEGTQTETAQDSILNSEIVKTTAHGSKEISELFGNKIFDYPKPSTVSEHLLKIATSEGVILDFFAGSATTAQAVLELNKGNRKFIMVQMPEPCDENSEAYKAGYKTIADIAKERIRRVIQKLTSPLPPLLKERGKEVSYAQELFKGAGTALFGNARSMRKEKTEAEDKLWRELRNKQIENCKFRRQHPIGNFIADFYCHEKKLLIEVDGGYHDKKEQQAYDLARTQIINEFGIKVIRFSNEEVLNDMQEVLKKITEALQLHSPSPSGEGAGGEVGFKVFKLSPSSFKIWRGAEIDSEEKLTQQMDAFTNPTRPGADKQNMLYELMLKAGYELTSPLTPLQMERGTRGEVYSINNNELIIALDAMNEKLVEQIIAAKPQKVIILDSLFTGNDQLKTNTVLQMRDAGVDFKTI